MRGGLSGSEGSSMDRDSIDDYTAEEMLVLATDQIDNLDIDQEVEVDCTGEVKSLIVTNVDLTVFTDSLAKTEFESRFLAFEEEIIFYYIRTFRRVRVDFASRSAAFAAKTELEAGMVGGNTVHCYWLRMLGPSEPGHVTFLAPPPLEKQFLISPPCSPPVGWEQPREDKPVVDYDLLAAMAQLGPGDNHELHPSKSVTICGQELDTPAIVVHVCEGGGVGEGRLGGGRACIVQTRRPERQSSIED